MSQQFAKALQRRQQAQRNAVSNQNTTIAINGQAPYRPGFPMRPEAFREKYGAPVNVVEHNRLRDSDDRPLVGFEFSRQIIEGVEPYVFASTALQDNGFTINEFTEALINGDPTLQVVSYVGSNDIYISQTKANVVADDTARAALARFKQPEE